MGLRFSSFVWGYHLLFGDFSINKIFFTTNLTFRVLAFQNMRHTDLGLVTILSPEFYPYFWPTVYKIKGFHGPSRSSITFIGYHRTWKTHLLSILLVYKKTWNKQTVEKHKSKTQIKELVSLWSLGPRILAVRVVLFPDFEAPYTPFFGFLTEASFVVMLIKSLTFGDWFSIQFLSPIFLKVRR